jgi:hypothetical protein
VGNAARLVELAAAERAAAQQREAELLRLLFSATITGGTDGSEGVGFSPGGGASGADSRDTGPEQEMEQLKEQMRIELRLEVRAREAAIRSELDAVRKELEVERKRHARSRAEALAAKFRSAAAPAALRGECAAPARDGPEDGAAGTEVAPTGLLTEAGEVGPTAEAMRATSRPAMEASVAQQKIVTVEAPGAVAARVEVKVPIAEEENVTVEDPVAVEASAGDAGVQADELKTARKHVEAAAGHQEAGAGHGEAAAGHVAIRATQSEIPVSAAAQGETLPSAGIQGELPVQPAAMPTAAVDASHPPAGSPTDAPAAAASAAAASDVAAHTDGEALAAMPGRAVVGSTPGAIDAKHSAAAHEAAPGEAAREAAVAVQDAAEAAAASGGAAANTAIAHLSVGGGKADAMSPNAAPVEASTMDETTPKGDLARPGMETKQEEVRTPKREPVRLPGDGTTQEREVTAKKEPARLRGDELT